MGKILVASGYINRLAVAIFLLTLSVGVSTTVLLAFMPRIQELSYELTRVSWGGFRLLLNNSIGCLIVLLVLLIGVQSVMNYLAAS